jgi:ClpP class serine protease
VARTDARRVMSLAATEPWMLAPEWSNTLRGAIALVLAGGAGRSPDQLREELRTHFAPLAADRPQATADLGEPLQGARSATVRDGIAIVSALGPLWHYANFFTDLCGHTAYEDVQADLLAIRGAHASGAVSGMLLEVDGPGGMVHGCADTARMIYELRAVMPVHSIITGQGCSASYYLAAAAERVHVSRGTLTGCIGTVASFRVAKSGEGVEVVEIVSEQTPRKRFDVRTPEGRSQVQRWVNGLGGEFIADVAEFRGVSEDDVMERFGQGDVMVAAEAVAAGLADEVGSFESVLAGLAQRASAARRGTPARGGITAHQEQTMAVEAIAPAPGDKGQRTAAERATTFASEHPEAAAIIRAEGATAERERIAAIDAAGFPGAEAIIAPLKADATKTAGDAALAIVAAIRDGTLAAPGAAAEKPKEEPAPVAAGQEPVSGANAHLSALQRVEGGLPKVAAAPVKVDDASEMDDELKAVLAAGS